MDRAVEHMRYLDAFCVDFMYFVTFWYWKFSVCLQALREELQQHKVRTVTDAFTPTACFSTFALYFVDFYLHI